MRGSEPVTLELYASQERRASFSKTTQTASIREKTVKGLQNNLPYPILPNGLQ